MGIGKGKGTAANPQASPSPSSSCSAKTPQTETWQLTFGYGALLLFAYFIFFFISFIFFLFLSFYFQINFILFINILRILMKKLSSPERRSSDFNQYKYVLHTVALYHVNPPGSPCPFYTRFPLCFHSQEACQVDTPPHPALWGSLHHLCFLPRRHK